MAINSHYTQECNIERVEAVGGGSRRQEWGTPYMGVPCAIRPAGGKAQGITSDGGFVYSHDMWCDPDVDVQVGDRVSVDGTFLYKVVEVTLRNYGTGSHVNHKRVKLTKNA